MIKIKKNSSLRSASKKRQIRKDRQSSIKEDLSFGLEFIDQTSLKTTEDVFSFLKSVEAAKFKKFLESPKDVPLSKLSSARRVTFFDKNRIKISFSEIVQLRQSSRSFIADKIERSDLLYLLKNSLGSSISRAGGIDCVTASLWIANVKGLRPGFYHYLTGNHSFRKFEVSPGLSKKLKSEFGNASGILFLRTQPKELVTIYGKRAWRFQWLAAGSAWAHFYLACAASGIGCCGIGGVMSDKIGLARQESKETQVLGAIVFGPL